MSPTGSLSVASEGQVEPRDNAMCPVSISLPAALGSAQTSIIAAPVD